MDKSAIEDAAYAEKHLADALNFPVKSLFWDYAATVIPNDGICLEFGVFKGQSINHLAAKRPNQKFFGFDSFEGLREDWKGYCLPRGFFNLGGILPKVEPNVTLIKGWFDSTVPQFLGGSTERVVFVHIDSDTYEAAQIVLSQLKGCIKPGTIIMFDEYMGHPNWRRGEFKAWQKFCSMNELKYRYIAFCTMQAIVDVI